MQIGMFWGPKSKHRASPGVAEIQVTVEAEPCWWQPWPVCDSIRGYIYKRVCGALLDKEAAMFRSIRKTWAGAASTNWRACVHGTKLRGCL